MPGAWELRSNPSVLCCILHVETSTVGWGLGLRRLCIPGPFQDPVPITGMPFDHARNEAASQIFHRGAEWLFFLDSDVIPPADAIYRLLAHNQPIISGLYCRRSPPAAVPVMLRDGMWITQYPPNSVVDVHLVGAGCLLIHRSVLEKLPPARPGKRWFDWRVDMKGILPPGECMSEDFVFCLNARKSGYKILVDTSIKCRHVGYAEATEGNLQPMNHG